jgi:hypothetical protein
MPLSGSPGRRIIAGWPPLPAFQQHLAAACADDSFVRLSLTSPHEPKALVQRIAAELVLLRGQRQLSFTRKEARSDTTQNVPLPEAIAWIERKLRTEFRSAMLATTQPDWQLQQPEGGEPRLIQHRASSKQAPRTRTPASSRRSARRTGCRSRIPACRSSTRGCRGSGWQHPGRRGRPARWRGRRCRPNPCRW